MKNAITIQQLESEGDKVVLKHFKREDGGYTTRAALITKTHILVGEAKCHPNDQFSKKKARAIALGRISKGKADRHLYSNEDEKNSLLASAVFSLV